MSETERKAAVEVLVKTVSRMPSNSRRKMAESMLEYVAWGRMGEREDMPRDASCSVCHDEVSGGSSSFEGHSANQKQYDETVKISITPCKHMYHKDCLDVRRPFFCLKLWADGVVDLAAYAEHIVLPDVQARSGGAVLSVTNGPGEEAGRCDGDMERDMRWYGGPWVGAGIAPVYIPFDGEAMIMDGWRWMMIEEGLGKMGACGAWCVEEVIRNSSLS